MLTSSFVPVIYDKEIQEIREDKTYVKQQKCVNIYYRDDGSTYEEFCFLLEYMFKTRLIEDYSEVKIRMSRRHEDYEALFEKAKKEFAQNFYDEEAHLSKLDSIKLESIPSAEYIYSAMAVGMERRKEFANAE